MGIGFRQWPVILLLAAVLAACGGSDGSPWTDNDDDDDAGGAPSVPAGATANAGDAAVSLGWSAPSSGTGPFTYTVTLSPAAGGSSVAQIGNTALVRGLVNNTAYTFSIRASNNAGQSAAATVQATPRAAPDGSGYSALAVTGNNSGNEASGVADPALLRVSASEVWLAYTSVDHTQAQASNVVRDSSVSLARSQDGGQTFTFSRTLASAQGPATVTDSTGGTVCGNITCGGRWIYSEPWLIDDSSDPDSNRRFKLFAHKVFLYPQNPPGPQYTLGAIALWTAPALTGTWTATEEILLGWNFTPPELTAHRNLNTLDPALNDCREFREGSATARSGVIDIALTCIYEDNTADLQKIVLLRSTDHGDSFDYVTTLLEAADAAVFSADFFAAPALLPGADNAPLLMVTPVDSGSYAGCIVLPFSNLQTGALYRDANGPRALLQLPTQNSRVGGACSWDRSLTAKGILMGDQNPALSKPFSILATGRAL